jgi:hypothetical protein
MLAALPIAGRGAAWSARLFWVQEVVGSNPAAPTTDRRHFVSVRQPRSRSAAGRRMVKKWRARTRAGWPRRGDAAKSPAPKGFLARSMAYPLIAAGTQNGTGTVRQQLRGAGRRLGGDDRLAEAMSASGQLKVNRIAAGPFRLHRAYPGGFHAGPNQKVATPGARPRTAGTSISRCL